MIYFASHQIIIRRLKTRAAHKWAYSATFTTYDADVQPITSEREGLPTGQIGKLYEAWIDVTVLVKEGDQVQTLTDSKIFNVKGVSIYSGAGLLDHKYLILIAQD